jgi:type II restriction enzyme
LKDSQPYQHHLRASTDLVTTYEATRAGFVSLAIEKNRKATPFIAEARALKIEASKAKIPSELLKIEKIRSSLLTAAGISDKALKYLKEEDKIEAIKGLIKKFLKPAGDDFVEELIYRFLLTRGDRLGGSMRNLGGLIGERKLSRAIISALAISKIRYQWLHSKSMKWVLASSDDTDIELHLKGLSWHSKGKWRALIYNIRVPLVEKNVDLCLLGAKPEEISLRGRRKESVHNRPSKYIALGELKGGIDPAGADEHWKTANSALVRIRNAFLKKSFSPLTFFIGAAIQNSMAVEIFSQLESGILTNAANLTNEDQVASLCSWIVRI